MDFDHVFGVITAVASVGALYFAYRTVREARAAATEARLDRRARKLERIIELITRIRLEIDGGPNLQGAEMAQDRLRPVLASIPDALPLTRQVAALQFEQGAYPENRKVCSYALDELREAVTNRD